MDPPLKGLQYQTLCAGEIECLLNRSRGVVMVQLSVGWDATAPQPVSNLLVLHSLERALGNKHIRINMSSAPGKALRLWLYVLVSPIFSRPCPWCRCSA